MKSINLIKLVDNCKSLPYLEIIVNEEAVSLFSKYKGPVSIVSACGEYRTGKSFLLNSLFEWECFDVSSTTEACTKGINMRREPIQQNGKNLWILDTEGFGSLDQDSKYDAKIFLLSVLFSEVLIYNSMGSIDEVSISKIALMCKEAEILINNSEQVNNKSLSHQFLGKSDFFWVLRDFSLSLIDKEGHPILPDRYLEESLIGSNEKSKMEKQCIKSFFKERHLFPLVRPCKTEKNLHSLSSLPPKNLRSEFLEEIKNINKQINANLKTKMIEGNEINGSQFSDILRYYVKMVNESNFSVGLSVTWNQIMNCEREKLAVKIEDKIKERIKHYESKLPLTDYEIEKLEKEFASIISENSDDLKYSKEQMELLNQEIHEAKKKLMTKFEHKNCEKIEEKCQFHLEDSYKQLVNRMIVNGSVSLSTFEDKFVDLMEKAKDSYENKFKNFNKVIQNSEYVRLLEKIQMDLFLKCTKKWNEDNEKMKEQNEEWRKVIKGLELKLKEKTISDESSRKEMTVAKKMFQESLKDIENYVDIISRMEKVSDNLKQEYRILELAHSTTVTDYEEKIEVYEKKEQILNSQIEELKRKYEEELENINSECKSKVEEILGVLANEREQFQELLVQKDSEENELKREMEGRENYNIEIQHKFMESTKTMKTDMEKLIKELNKESEMKISEKELRITDLQSKLLLNQNEMEVLTSKYVEIVKFCENGKNEMSEYERKMKLLENELKEKENSLNNQKSLVKSIQEQSEKDHIKFGIEKSNLEVKLKLAEETNLKEAQKFDEEMQKSEEHFEKGSKESEKVLKESFNLEKQQIVNKLTEAAERIEFMNGKEIQSNLKIIEYEERMREMKEVIEKLHQERNEPIKNQLNHQNLRLKQSKSQRTFVRYEEEKDDSEKNIEILRLNENIHKKDVLLISLTQKLEKYVEMNERLTHKLAEIGKDPHGFENPENIKKSDFITLIRENENLKEELEKEQMKSEKIKNESMRCINFHYLLKKNLGEEHANKRTGGEKMKENILSKTFEDLKNASGIESKKTVEYLEEIVITKSKELEIEKNKYCRHLSELDELIVLQKEEIEKCNQKEKVYLVEIENLCQLKESNKQKFELKVAELTSNFDKTWKELGDANKRYAVLVKEVDVWKNKALNVEKITKERSERSSAYREKIDGIFNKL